MVRVGRFNIKWMDIDMPELELVKLISHFAQSNKAEAKSPKTISWYTEMLTDYVKFLKATGRDAILAKLNSEIVREFIISEQGRKISPYTVQGKTRALKAFSSWLSAEGYTSDNLLANIKLPKAPVKIIEPLTTTEVDTLISTQNPLTAIGARNIAILITLLDTGLRNSELSGLRFEDAHIEEGYLKVTGKGNKERLVPIGALAQKVLWRYVFHFRPEPVNEVNNCLFLTLDGNCLQTNAVKLLLRRWGKKARVPRLHAHLCRHTYATNYLTHNCGDVFRLQRILGHSTLEMVNRYVHYASAQSMIQSHPSSPVDHLGIKKLAGYKIDRALKRSVARVNTALNKQ
jgi:integrase/recombinase XerC/integrase/recombinase XerD